MGHWLQKKLKTWENNKVARKKEEIQQEYNSLCAQIGELQFHGKVIEARIAQGNGRIAELQKEMELLDKAPAQPETPAQSAPEAAVVASPSEVPSEVA